MRGKRCRSGDRQGKVRRNVTIVMPFAPRERAFVEAARVGRLATATSDGRPHLVPVCFAVVENSIVSIIDEKPKTRAPSRLRRIRNVEENDAVSLLVDRYTEAWEHLGWVRVDGTCEVSGPDDEIHAPALAALRSKYDQYADHHLDDRPLLVLEPGTVTSWGTLSWN